MEQDVAARFREDEIAQPNLVATTDLEVDFAVEKPDSGTGQADLRGGEEVNRMMGVDGYERLGPRFGRFVADVRIGRVFDDEGPLFPDHVHDCVSSGLREGDPARVVTIGNGVIEREAVTVGASLSDLRSQHGEVGSLFVHIHAVKVSSPIERRSREETRIGRGIDDVGDVLSTSFEGRAEQRDAACRADRGDTPRRVELGVEVVAVDGGEGLSRPDGSEGVGIPVHACHELAELGVANLLGARLGGEVREVGVPVLDVGCRIGYLRVRISRSEVVQLEPFFQRDRSELDERGRHLTRDRYGPQDKCGGLDWFAHGIPLLSPRRER